jgi:hypothetical protein
VTRLTSQAAIVRRGPELLSRWPAGEEGMEPRDLPSSKRRAGSTENLLYLEALASLLPPVGSLPAQVTNRCGQRCLRLHGGPCMIHGSRGEAQEMQGRRGNDQEEVQRPTVAPLLLRRVQQLGPEPAQPASSSSLPSPPAATSLPAARDCDGSCGCPGERLRAIEARFTLSHATILPADELASCSPFAEARAALVAGPVPPAAGVHIDRCVSADSARAQPPAGPARLCSLFLSSSSSSLVLVEPPSLIGPSISPRKGASLDDDTASPPSTTSCASTFGTYASAFASGIGGPGDARGLHHSRSEDALLERGAACGSAEWGPSRPSIDLGPPRASMDSFCVMSSHFNEGSAAEELFYRLNHARQTVDFVKRQVRAVGGGWWRAGGRQAGRPAGLIRARALLGFFRLTSDGFPCWPAATGLPACVHARAICSRIAPEA